MKKQTEDKIIKLIYKYEKNGGDGDMGLSDGYKWYGGILAVEELAKELSQLIAKERKEAVELTIKKIDNSLRSNVDSIKHCYHYFGNNAEELLKEDKKMYTEGLLKVRKTMKNILSGKWQKITCTSEDEGGPAIGRFDG